MILLQRLFEVACIFSTVNVGNVYVRREGHSWHSESRGRMALLGILCAVPVPRKHVFASGPYYVFFTPIFVYSFPILPLSNSFFSDYLYSLQFHQLCSLFHLLSISQSLFYPTVCIQIMYYYTFSFVSSSLIFAHYFFLYYFFFSLHSAYD